MHVLPVWLYVYHLPACGYQKKKVSDPLKLESWMVVSLHVDAGVALSGPVHEQQVVLTAEPSL